MLFLQPKLFSQAQIVLANDTFDLGVRRILLDSNNSDKGNQTIKFKVSIKNGGNKPLTITRCFGDGYFSESLKKPIPANGKDSLKITIYRYKAKKVTPKGTYFCNPVIISGNFPEHDKIIYVKGYFIKEKK